MMRYTFAPREFSRMVSDTLIGMPYVKEDVPGVPICDPKIGFNCWGLVRNLFLLTGTELPVNVKLAARLFRRVYEPEYRDVLVIEPFKFLDQVHVGFMESYDRVIHCSEYLGGVSRTPLSYFVNARALYRLK